MSRYTALAVAALLMATPATAQTASAPSKPSLFPYGCSVRTVNFTTEDDGKHVHTNTSVTSVQTEKDCAVQFDAANDAVAKSMQVFTRGDHTSVVEAFAVRTNNGDYVVDYGSAHRPLDQGNAYLQGKIHGFLAAYMNNK